MSQAAPPKLSAFFRERNVILALIAVALGFGLFYGVRFATTRIKRAKARAEINSLLKSPNKDDRRKAAQMAATCNDEDLFSRLRLAIMGDEPEPGVRAAAIEALGQTLARQYFEVVEFAVDLDSSGRVRAAGWLAAARLDRRRCEALLQQHADRADPWDRVGRAQARLYLGDVSELDVLFEYARDDNPELNRAACRALQRWLRPILDAAGCWPLGADPPINGPWSLELITELQARCRQIDLPRAALDTHRQLTRSAFARKMERRLASGRNQVTQLLFERSGVENSDED